jgi:hypothetical protein
MEAAVKRMEAQLRRWSLKIDHLAARTQTAGVQARFDVLTYLDELKALHAVAQSKLVELKALATGDARCARLEAEMNVARDELAAALANPVP